MLAERADPLIGAMLGKDYRVLERLGSGGMAVVYLVEHQTLLKRFAAKVLSTELASSLEARARFAQEAHAASQLDHENIVSISDFGVTLDHRPFFVMELLRGQTLDQRLVEGPMSLEEVVAVSVPVARALAHAHAEGIVHRDVKPENIFLVQRSQGRWGVKVVDFGIAKTPLHPKLTHTKPKLGETLGSPKYMSPEMCRGDDEEVDQRADIYSFGVVLYLVLCGRLPFDDDNLLRVLQMHLSEPLPPPREVNPALAPELAAILERALAKQPDDRYPSMDALLLDLEAALPAGSDRVLIEAQSGTALGETPFAGALSSPRISAQRAAEPAPSTSGILPIAPRRSRASLAVALGVVAASAGGVAAWRYLLAPAQSTAASSAPVSVARVEVTPPLAAPPAGVEVAPAPPPPADHAAPPPADQAAPRPADPPVAGESAPASAPPPADPPAPAPSPTGTDAAPPARAAIAASATGPKPGRPAPSLKRFTPVRPTVARNRRRPAPPGETAAPAPQVVTAPGSAEPAPEPGVAPETPPTGEANGAVDHAGAAAPSPPAPPAPTLTPPPQPPIPPPPAPPDPPSVAAPKAAPAPKGPGALDAVPEITGLEVKGSLSPSVVRRSVERALPALRACYVAAARAGRTTPALDLQLSFEIDENGLAIHAATGRASFGSLARCAAGVAGQIHTPVAPDTGTAPVAVVIRFRPL